MHISGSGHISGGEYHEDCSVSGSAKINGDLRCIRFSCSGSANGVGNLTCEEGVKVSGSLHIRRSVHAKMIHASGSFHVDGDCTGSEEIKTSGAFHCGGNVKTTVLHIAGALSAEGGIEAEEAYISGKIVTAGLLNAEKVVLRLEGAPSHINAIGGSEITIQKNPYKTNMSRLPFLGKFFSSTGELRVSEAIEGDVISLENTTVPLVVGRIVTIGPGCKIVRVQYSEELHLDPVAEVGTSEKI